MERAVIKGFALGGCILLLQLGIDKQKSLNRHIQRPARV
jgi:hypothetical protein